MIRELVALSLKFRVLVVGVAVVVMGLGVFQLRSASVDALPEFAPPTVTVQAEANGLSAAEVEQYVTTGLEQDLLNGVPWLDHMESNSSAGLVRVDLVFKPGTDPLKARQAVQERLTQAYVLPQVGTPPTMLQPLSSTSRVMMVGLSSKDLSLTDLSVLARWKIKPRLTGIPGVANVSIWGQRDRQLQVQVDPDKLRQNGVTLNQVISTAGNALFVSPLNFLQASTPGTGGFVDTSTQRLAIQHVLPVTTAKNLSSVTIEDTTGRSLTLGDVASVVEDHQPYLIGDAVLHNGPGLMLVIQKFPEASTQQVTRGVQDALAALRPGLSGVAIDTGVYQAQSFVDTAIHDLGVVGLVSLAMFVLVVGLLLLSWRRAVITVTAALLSLVAAAYVLYLRGTTFNLMVLGGLAMALGVVVDDAVAELGAVRRRLGEHRASGASASIATVIAEASGAVRGPLLYGTLVALLVPLPLLFLDGVAGSFTRPIVLSYAIAVAVSTVVALAVTPALASLLLGGASDDRPGPGLRVAHRVFDVTVARLIGQPRAAYAMVALLLAAGLAVVPQLTTRAALPTPQDRNVLVRWQAVPGTSLAEMDRITGAASTELRHLSGVRDVGAHVGRAIASDEVVGVNAGEMWVSLNDTAGYDATLAAVRRVLRGYPGLASTIESYTQDRVDAVTADAGTGSDLAVRVYGTDLATLKSTAQEMGRRVARVNGVVQPKVLEQPEQPTLEVKVDLDAAQKYGMAPGDVRRAASTFFAGTLVGNLYQDQRIFDVVVWSTPSTRYAPANLADLMVDTPAGPQVRLGDVASVKVVPYPTQLLHDADSRYVEIDAQIGGRDTGAVLNDVRRQVAAMPMPLEYHAEVFSQLAQQQGQDRTMLGLAAGTAIVIFLLLQAAFGSWRLATLASLLLPLSLVGGIAGNLLAGGELSLAAMLGLVTVLGLTARHIVVLVCGYLRLEAAEGFVDRGAAVRRVTRDRVGPILLTAAATAAVFVPVLVAGSRPGTEVLYPMAAVVLGGLVSSTLVALVVVPSLYLRFAPALTLTGRGTSRVRLRPRGERVVTSSPMGEG